MKFIYLDITLSISKDSNIKAVTDAKEGQFRFRGIHRRGLNT